MMSKNPKRSILPSLMAGASLVMACIIYAEVRARPMIQTSSQPTMAEVRIASLPAQRQAMPEKARFAAIVERPLFSPSRRPHSEEPALVPTPTLDFSLSGIVISTGEPFALIKSGAGGDPVRMKQGEEISGWTVGRIESDRILVRHGRTERELLLDFAAPAPPPPELAMPKDAQADGKAGTQANEQGTSKNNGGTGDGNTPAPPPEAEEPAPAD